MDNFKRDRIQYFAELRQYQRQYDEWVLSQGTDDQRDEPVRPTPPRWPTENPKDPESEGRSRPVDPRVERFNMIFGERYFKIVESGAKLWETSATKLSKKDDPDMSTSAFLDASELGDGNRITIIPHDFGMVDRALEIISKHSNTFVQEPRISRSGHFDQKTYTDIRAVKDGVPSQKLGPVAEIKIEEEHIHRAHKRTHGVYKLMGRIERHKFAPTDPQTIDAIRHGYEKLRSSLSKYYEMQPCPEPDKFKTTEGCQFCYDELLHLHQGIYADAMKHAPRKWQAKYMMEALELNERLTKDKKSGFPTSLLQSINPELFDQVVSEHAKAQKKPGPERGRD